MNLQQAKAKAVSENPFYGSAGLMGMMRAFERVPDENATKASVWGAMDLAWADVKGDEDKKKLFFVMVFNAGDISNREHNMFGKIKVQQGGHAKRNTFRYAMEWILTKQPKQFYNFLPIVSEYTNYENLFYNQVRTDRKTGKLITHDFLPINHEKVAAYLAAKIADRKTSDFELACIAKFLPKPPSGTRTRISKDGTKSVREKKEHTKEKDKLTFKLITALSNAMEWEVERKEIPGRKVEEGKDPETFPIYSGYTAFRSKYLKDTEAYLFSTKAIEQFDKVQFLTWLEGLPANARYRVQCRILDKDSAGKLSTNKKWSLKTGEFMGDAYQEWLKGKEEAMKKLLSLTEEDKKATDKTALKALEKQAKVTTGAKTMYDCMLDMYKSSNTPEETALVMQRLIDMVKVDVPVLSILDLSGSMGAKIDCKDSINVLRVDFAKLVLSIMLYKNPNPDLAGMFFTYGTDAKIYADGAKMEVTKMVSRFVQGAPTSVTLPALSDRSAPFIETFKFIQGLFNTEGVTNLEAISNRLRQWVNEDPALSTMRKECIQQYPVWLIISDGMFNNRRTGPASISKFQQDLRQYFGAEPVIVLWNVGFDRGYGQDDEDSIFEGIENFMVVSGVNAATLNQVFTKIGDMDVIDVYTPLKSLYLSDRYEPVKHLTL